MTIHGSVSGPGGLMKSGAGTLLFYGANAYAGDTTVKAGKLSIGVRSFADRADVFLSTGAALELRFTGSPDTIDSLFIDGISQRVGTWGAVGSGAQFTSPLIIGTGMLQVTTFIAPPLAGDYNSDGMVDAADYVVWRKSMGSGASLPNDDTPGVGPDDFTRWRTNFGRTIGLAADDGSSSDAGSAAVPETGGSLTFLVAIVATVFHRRRAA